MKNNKKITDKIEELKQASNKPVIVFEDENGEIYIGYDKEKTALFLPADQITGTEDAAKLSKIVHAAEGDGIREYFILIFLNRANRPTGYQVASIGGACGTVVDTPLICRAAILADCRSVIATHNHPRSRKPGDKRARKKCDSNSALP